MYTSLVVFFDEVVDGLTAEDPIGGIDIALEDGGTEDDGCIALCIDGLFDAVQKHCLLGNIRVDHLDFITWWNACCQFLNGLYLAPGIGYLFEEVDLLLIGEFLACIFGEVEGRYDRI